MGVLRKVLKYSTIVAEASGGSFIMVVGTVAIPSAKSAIGNWTFQRATVNRGHGDGILAVL